MAKALFDEYLTVELFLRKHPVFRARKQADLDMDYRLFFEGHPEAADVLRFVEAQQEDRDSAEELATRRSERSLAARR